MNLDISINIEMLYHDESKARAIVKITEIDVYDNVPIFATRVSKEIETPDECTEDLGENLRAQARFAVFSIVSGKLRKNNILEEI